MSFIEDTMALMDSIDALIEAGTMVRKERTRRPLEKAMAGKVAKMFMRQGNSFLAGFSALKSKLPSGDETITEAAKTLDWERYYNATTKAAATALLDAISAGVDAALKAGADGLIADLKLDVGFDVENPLAVAYAESRGAENVAAINETTREYLRTLITEGVDNGWSYGKLASAIRARFEEFSRERAMLIAVTEVGNAYEAGSRVMVDDLMAGGLEMEKSWLTAGDSKTDDLCVANEAQGWIPADEAHASGDMQPLAHPRCRCTELYRRKGSE